MNSNPTHRQERRRNRQVPLTTSFTSRHSSSGWSLARLLPRGAVARPTCRPRGRAACRRQVRCLRSSRTCRGHAVHDVRGHRNQLDEQEDGLDGLSLLRNVFDARTSANELMQVRRTKDVERLMCSARNPTHGGPRRYAAYPIALTRAVATAAPTLLRRDASVMSIGNKGPRAIPLQAITATASHGSDCSDSPTSVVVETTAAAHHTVLAAPSRSTIRSPKLREMNIELLNTTTATAPAVAPPPRSRETSKAD